MPLIDLLSEFCNTYEEVHAAGLGLDVGVLMGLGAPITFGDYMIPVTFPPISRQQCIDEYPYYLTGLAIGYANASPSVRARAKAVTAVVKLWWERVTCGN